MTKEKTDPAESFIEQMGLIVQAEGGPRIAGRIFGLFLLEGGPLTLQEVASRLKISKGSASTNARMLAQRSLLRLTSRAGDRQDYYELAPNPYQHMLGDISERMRRNAETLAETEARLPPDMAKARVRIGELAEFYRISAGVLADWSEQLAVKGVSSKMPETPLRRESRG